MKFRIFTASAFFALTLTSPATAQDAGCINRLDAKTSSGDELLACLVEMQDQMNALAMRLKLAEAKSSYDENHVKGLIGAEVDTMNTRLTSSESSVESLSEELTIIRESIGGIDNQSVATADSALVPLQNELEETGTRLSSLEQDLKSLSEATDAALSSKTSGRVLATERFECAYNLKLENNPGWTDACSKFVPLKSSEDYFVVTTVEAIDAPHNAFSPSFRYIVQDQTPSGFRLRVQVARHSVNTLQVRWIAISAPKS